MKIPSIIVLLVALSCLVGCSDNSSNNSMLLVPPNAAKVLKSPSYRLEHTTASGIKCYVRPLVPEIARTISVDNPDFEYLRGDDINPYYLLVLIRNNKIIDKEAAEGGALTDTDQAELESFLKTYVPPHEGATNTATAVEPTPAPTEAPTQEPAPAPEMPKEGEKK